MPEVCRGKLTREWVFADVAAAVRFVNQVASVAKTDGHHADIDVQYNKVRLSLIMHSTGTVTAIDAKLAEQMARQSPG